jgi:hypothetical protein
MDVALIGGRGHIGYLLGYVRLKLGLAKSTWCSYKLAVTQDKLTVEAGVDRDNRSFGHA